MIPGARLILLGRQGAGKGTQCIRLSRHYVVPHVSTGDILRAAVREGTELGKQAKAIMDAGGLVGDDIVIGIVQERLTKRDAVTRGYLLDGFPRTVPQAEALGKMLQSRTQKVDVVVALEVAADLLIERAVLRRTDKRTGQIYHLKYNPPPPDADLEHRADDQEDVVRKRVETYQKMTAELLPYYEKVGLLRRVDGVGTVDEVKARVFGAIDSRP